MTAFRRSILSPLSLSLLILPLAAWADAGTPLMWAGAFHLVIGNVIIGVIEGLVLTRLFRVRRVLSIFVMVVANYFSAWMGFLFLTYWGETFSNWFLGEYPLYRIQIYFWSMFGLFYLATIILEWPFCVWLLLGQGSPFRKSLLATVLAQTLSYALLVPFFYSLSSTSIFDQLEMVDAGSLSQGEAVQSILFISPFDGDLYSIHSDGSNLQNLYSAGVFTKEPILIFRRDWITGRWSLFCHPKAWMEEEISIPIGLPVCPPPSGVLAETYPDRTTHADRLVDLRPSIEKEMLVGVGDYAREGIHFWNNTTQTGSLFALETPFLSWVARYPTALPGNQFIFQLADRIVLLDLPKRQMACITKGLGPLVVLEKELEHPVVLEATGEVSFTPSGG